MKKRTGCILVVFFVSVVLSPAFAASTERSFQLAQAQSEGASENQGEKSLEERKQELEKEYDYLVNEAERLKAFKEKMKTDSEKRLYNDWVDALNQKVDAYEKNRRAFETDVERYRSGAGASQQAETGRKADAASAPAAQPKASEPAGTPEDQEISATRQRLQEREERLQKEFRALMQKKKDIEKAMEVAQSGDGPEVEESVIRELNEEIQQYEKKREALNADIEAYNKRARGETAPDSKP